MAPSASLQDFPVVVTLPVVWGEMDVMGHVNNVVYFRWFETARTEYLQRIGLWSSFEQTRIGPILASAQCRFRRAVKWPDTVHVGTRTTALGDDRFTLEFAVISQGLGAVVASGEGLMVVYDYAGERKTSMPAAVRGALVALEASVGRTVG